MEHLHDRSGLPSRPVWKGQRLHECSDRQPQTSWGSKPRCLPINEKAVVHGRQKIKLEDFNMKLTSKERNNREAKFMLHQINQVTGKYALLQVSQQAWT